jgi:hypothetical protein
MAAGKAKKPAKAPKSGRRTINGWRADALDLRLSADDLDLLDNAITVMPILRVVVALGQEARRRGLEYPVASARELQSCLAGETLTFAGHQIDDEAIERTMPEGWFPIAHEGELLSRVHLALIRCEMEARAQAPRPVIRPN